jgi:single-strand DNA-binding protein
MLRLTAVRNLGADAELRYTAKSTPIAQFRVAINQVRLAADGEREESTEWVRVSVAGRQATYASQFSKGQRVLVTGRLQNHAFRTTRRHTGDGLDLWADEVVNVSGRAWARRTATDAELSTHQGSSGPRDTGRVASRSHVLWVPSDNRSL